jgi:hypothetical protein
MQISELAGQDSTAAQLASTLVHKDPLGDKSYVTKRKSENMLWARLEYSAFTATLTSCLGSQKGFYAKRYEVSCQFPTTTTTSTRTHITASRSSDTKCNIELGQYLWAVRFDCLRPLCMGTLGQSRQGPGDGLSDVVRSLAQRRAIIEEHSHHPAQ